MSQKHDVSADWIIFLGTDSYYYGKSGSSGKIIYNGLVYNTVKNSVTGSLTGSVYDATLKRYEGYISGVLQSYIDFDSGNIYVINLTGSGIISGSTVAATTLSVASFNPVNINATNVTGSSNISGSTVYAGTVLSGSKIVVSGNISGSSFSGSIPMAARINSGTEIIKPRLNFIGGTSITLTDNSAGTDEYDITIASTISVASGSKGPYQFIIYSGALVGGSGPYFAKDSDGIMRFSGSNASTVTNAVLTGASGLTSGRNWREKAVIKGIFAISSPIYIESYTILEIQGRIYAQDSYTSGLSLIRNRNISTGDNDIEIYGGEIDGRRTSQGSNGHFGIYFTTVDDFSIHDVYLHAINKSSNSNGRGIQLNDCSMGIVYGNTVRSCDHAGIHISCDTSTSHDILVENNQVENLGSGVLWDSSALICVYGYSGQDIYRINIVGNRLSGSTTEGIQIYRYAHSCGVIGNEINGVWGYSIIGGSVWVSDAWPANNCTVVGNTITIPNVGASSDEQCGIRWVGRYCTFTGNTINMNQLGKHGIEVILTGSTIADNTILNPGYHGIYFTQSGSWACNHNTISGNTIVGMGTPLASGYDGIYLATLANYNTIVGNTIRNWTDGASRAIDIRGDYNFIHGNNCYGNGATTFTDSGTGNQWHDNILSSGTYRHSGSS